MARTLSLEDVSGDETIDLLNGTLKLQAGTRRLMTPEVRSSYEGEIFGSRMVFQRYEPVTEVMDLQGEGTVSDLISAYNDLA